MTMVRKWIEGDCSENRSIVLDDKQQAINKQLTVSSTENTALQWLTVHSVQWRTKKHSCRHSYFLYIYSIYRICYIYVFLLFFSATYSFKCNLNSSPPHTFIVLQNDSLAVYTWREGFSFTHCVCLVLPKASIQYITLQSFRLKRSKTFINNDSIDYFVLIDGWMLAGVV